MAGGTAGVRPVDVQVGRATAVLADLEAPVAASAPGSPGPDAAARSQALVALLEARDRLDAAVVALAGVWDAGSDWSVDGARSPVAWLAHRAPLTRQEAAALVRTARFARRHAGTGAALAAGDVRAAHVGLLARAARGRGEAYAAHEAILLGVARDLPPAECRAAVEHWAHCVDAVTGGAPVADGAANVLHASAALGGTGILDGRLDPVSFRALVRRLDALEPPDPLHGARPPRSAARRRADALMRLVHGDGRRARATVDVVVDVDTLAGRVAVDPRDGCCELAGSGPVSPHLARTLACDGAIGRVLLRGRSEVVDLGRRTRVVSPALRRLLERRDRSCVEDGCDVPAEWCDVHHVVPWWAHGPTSAANTELRCRTHHVRHHAADRLRFRRSGGGVRGDPGPG
jgi:hypothetical protein